MHIIMDEFEEIKSDMKVGHEVDFTFNGKKCSLLHTTKGRAFWVDGDLVLLDKNLESFLETPCLDGLSVKDIFEKELYEPSSVTIF